MAERSYLNFDLELERRGEGYGAQVVASPLDRACCSEFNMSPDDARPGEKASLDDIKAYGTGLFRSVFDDEIYSHLRLSQDEAERQGADGLRIRLILTDVPELADVPWEYLYDPSRAQFLSLSTKTPIVRYLDLSERVRPLAVRPPLRVLVMISSPADLPALDADQEWVRLNQALAELQAAGRVKLDLLEDATLPALQDRMREREYHVFHYVGHGAFDERQQDGMLVLEDKEGLSRPVKGEVLRRSAAQRPSDEAGPTQCLSRGPKAPEPTSLPGQPKAWCENRSRRSLPCRLPSPTRRPGPLPPSSTGRWPTTIRWTRPSRKRGWPSTSRATSGSGPSPCSLCALLTPAWERPIRRNRSGPAGRH